MKEREMNDMLYFVDKVKNETWESHDGNFIYGMWKDAIDKYGMDNIHSYVNDGEWIVEPKINVKEA